MCVRRQIGRCLSGEERAGATRRLCPSRRRRPRQRSPERRAELVGRGAAAPLPAAPPPRARHTRPAASSFPVSLRGHRVALLSLVTKKKQKEKPPRLYFPSGQVRSIGFTGLSDSSEGTERCRPDTVGRSRQPDGGGKLPARSCFYCPTYQDHPDGPVGPTRGSAAIPEQLRAVV